MLLLGSFSTRKTSSFITSVDVSWLDEFANKSTVDDFWTRYNLPRKGKDLFYEIDYENLSGESNPNVTPAKDALKIITAIVDLYKSEKFNFLKTFIFPPGTPLTDSRLFFGEHLVYFPDAFYHGFTPAEFFKMKNLAVDTERVYANLPVDDFSGAKHKVSKGDRVELIFKQENEFEKKKQKILPVLDYLQDAANKGYYVQIMTG